MEFLFEYGLFLAKAVTIVGAIVVIVGVVAGAAMKQKPSKGQLEFTSLSDQIDDVKDYATEMMLSKDELKKLNKEKKKQAKKDKKDVEPKSKLFVLDFDGSTDANEVDSLREEVTAILCAAGEKDEVLVRLESGGGVVHAYGLAASQLQRLKDKSLPLTIAVDKVAASGGYMMACVANHVLAARFAIIGSIGVIAQLPNFNKLLKKHDIDYEQHTAGQFKRTLTVFGENNDDGREKFKEELEEVHQMFKTFVSANRPELDIDLVATGEYWYGAKAQELGLVDEIGTSDDYLLSKAQTHDIFSVTYKTRKNVAERLGMAAASIAENVTSRLWQKSQQWFH